MAKLMVVVSVVARDSVIARASVRLAGTVDEGRVVTRTATVDAAAPWELKILSGLTTVVDEMSAAGVSGVVFIAGSVMPRFLQAKKLIDRHNAVDIMILPWMKKEGKEELYRAAFTNLLAALRRAKNRDVTVIVRDVRDLYKVKLEGAAGLVGTTVDIRNGISEEYGVRVIGNDRFAGKVIIREVSERGNIVSYGEIIPDSLFGNAKSFTSYGKEAVAAALNLLPAPVMKEDGNRCVVNGDF